MRKKSIVFLLLVAVLYILPFSVVQARENNYEEVTKYIQNHVDKFNIPGMSWVFIEKGEIQELEGYGVLEAGTDTPVTPETIYGIASVSKNITALAILQLEEKGLLSLSDPVVKHLPWFGTKDVEASKKITIENLLRHTSGIPATAYGLELKNGTEDDLEAQVRELSKINLIGTPGEVWQYSNMNFWTQALLVEKLTGMKFADYMEENVFQPLDMTRTGYYRQIADKSNVAMGHRYENGQSRPFDYHVPAPTNAAGGVYTTAVDMTKYIAAILYGDYKGTSVLSDASREKWLYTGLNDEKFNYSYGWMTDVRDGVEVIHHGGDNPNFTAEIYLIPEEEIGFALLSNSQHVLTHNLANNIANYLIGEELVPVETTNTEAGAQMAKMIAYASYIILLIAVLWMVFAIRGIKKGVYVLTSKFPGIIRTIFQVILIPLVGVGVAFIGYQLPINMIGSYHVALLYQPDLVKNLLGLVTVVVLFTFLTGFMAFVRKPKSNSISG